VFQYGLFINALISFLLIAAAIYYVVVVPMNKLAERRQRGQDPATKECPECLSEIPHAARKCAFCGSPQNDVATA
jgi:large conductance mechanosensitive channel